MRSGKKKLRFLSFCFLLIFLVSGVINPGMVSLASGEQSGNLKTATEMVEIAVSFINDKYKAGETIDPYTAFILSLAGEDLESEKWSYNGQTLKGRIQKKADLLGDSNSLITYITATQNSDGSFGPFANEYGTKAPLQALSMVKDDLSVGSYVYNEVQDAIAESVSYFKGKYQNGTPYEVSGWNFDYRCVEALTAAGEDLSVGDWVYEGNSLKNAVLNSASDSANDTSAYDAVYLSKEIRALHSVDPSSSSIGILADAVAEKQAEDGSFGNNVYDHVTVLIALGKAEKISEINQNKALEYLNTFKHSHTDSWGNPAGAAWGGFSDEEPDLTAQVITALSYFEGANTSGTPVNQAIEDGLAYLMDIQDDDTAAIPAAYDSTFSTAETLIALKSIGMTYDEYAGESSTWAKKSKTKTIALYLLALNSFNDIERVGYLADILIGRQKTEGLDKGSFDNSIYSDFWGYIALGEAGKITDLNTADVREYILSKQRSEQDAFGSWGEVYSGQYYPDVLSTLQAIQALTYLPDYDNDEEIQNSINTGLTYLKTLQQDDGGVYMTPFDDPAVDNSELIVTFTKLGIDPESVEWTKNIDGVKVNPVSYLMQHTLNDDGSFGMSKNIYGAAEALYAYILQQDVDMIERVKQGINYLEEQHLTDDTTHMYKKYGGYNTFRVLKLAGEDPAGDRWTKDGKSLETRLLEDAAGLSEESDITEISKTLLGLCGLDSKAEDELERLAGLITVMQKDTGNFADGVIYNEILPYLALTVSDKWDLLSSEKQRQAEEWLINAQTKEGADKGSWKHSWGVDTVSTARAIYVLSGFDDSKTEGTAAYQAVQDGLAWLKSKQDSTGRILGGQWDDPIVDTSETILAVLKAGQDPKGEHWTNEGSNLINYLVQKNNQNSDGSIGDQANYSGNVGSTVPALLALLEYNEVFGWINFGSVSYDEGDENDENNNNEEIDNGGSLPSDGYNVEIAVVGQDEEILYGPDTVTVTKSGKWGRTALGALHATGLSYEEDDGFVNEIEGQKNSGMNGWMYKINDSVPTVLASEKKVSEGDRVLWWYSNGADRDGPDWDSLFADIPTVGNNEDVSPALIKISKELQESLDELAKELGLEEDKNELGTLMEVEKAVVVVGSDKMPWDKKIKLKEKLQNNTVNIVQVVGGNKNTMAVDRAGEMVLKVPADALGSQVQVAVKEEKVLDSNELDEVLGKVPEGFRKLSPVYRFTPNGLNFKVPATLQLKVVVPPFVKPDNLYLGWYDKKNDVWTAIPSAFDEKTGQLAARISHFSDYAVFGRLSHRPFDDVNSSYQWARHEIEILAGAEIISGVSKEMFEPGRSITRAELVSLLARALSLSADGTTDGNTQKFRDISSKDWYAADIAAAVNNGLIEGYNDRTFRPNQPVTREELAVILAKAAALDLSEPSESGFNLSYSDEKLVSSWAKASVHAITENGFIKGYPDGSFKPSAPASRAECAVMIYRMLEY